MVATVCIGAGDDVDSSSCDGTRASPSAASFSEEVRTVTETFERWNDCERTVFMYLLLNRLRYPTLKLLQHYINCNLTQNLSSPSHIDCLMLDINANNALFLQKLLQRYTSNSSCDDMDALAVSSDKESMACYVSDFHLTHCDERNFSHKEEVLNELLRMVPLLKLGNEGAKQIYLAIMPIAVRDTIRGIVSAEVVQQIFSYLLIHPALTHDDRRSLSVWARHFEDHIQSSAVPLTASLTGGCVGQQLQQGVLFLKPQNTVVNSREMLFKRNSLASSDFIPPSSFSACSSASCSSLSDASVAPSVTNLTLAWASASSITRNTLAPLNESQHKSTKQELANGISKSALGSLAGGIGGIADQPWDSYNGFILNELASTQYSSESSTFADTVVAAPAVSATTRLFGDSKNSMQDILNNNNLNTNDDHEPLLAKNDTGILDFEHRSKSSGSDNCTHDNCVIPPCPQKLDYASILKGNCDHMDCKRWTLDNKWSCSNSLTPHNTYSSSVSSESLITTASDNCSNSTEHREQFAHKPRSFSLSLEHQREAFANSGSDPRFDDFTPRYIRFQTRNMGMSCFGLWLKSLRLHKYIDLFKNTTYEEMLHLTEEYLQRLGFTNGASHKLVLRIANLKERPRHLIHMEHCLANGQMKVHAVVKELADIVLTPMKPVDAVNAAAGEDNVALLFLRVIDAVCTVIQNDPYATQDDMDVIMCILDLSIQNEAFACHVSHLKEWKFRLSNLGITLLPKKHQVKNTGNANFNKKRPSSLGWNGKTLKCYGKNGRSDRKNHC